MIVTVATLGGDPCVPAGGSSITSNTSSSSRANSSSVIGRSAHATDSEAGIVIVAEVEVKSSPSMENNHKANRRSILSVR